MDLKTNTNNILKKYNLYAKKKFGQNFLIDEEILDNIVDSADLSQNDIVIEIGPGLGNLTKKLLETKAKVIAFEIDKEMAKILKDRFGDMKNFTLIVGDILKENISEYVKYRNKEAKIKVVANLPYYITTPIIFKLLEEIKLKTTEIIVMVQREVANRLIAKPNSKDYSVLTIEAAVFARVEKLFDVDPQCFIPSPNVVSSVVKLTSDKKYNIQSKDMFDKLVKSAFSMRRKKVVNSLVNTKFNDLSKQEIERLLEDNQIEVNSRAEDIPVEKYVDMSNQLI